MNRIIRPLFGGLFALAIAIGAFALPARADKVIIHPGENIGSADSNQAWRYAQEWFGAWASQLLGLTNSGSGAYGGLTVVGQTNITATVNTPSNAFGLIVQVTQVDPSPIPQPDTPQLPADTTLGLVPFFQTANSTPFPIATPTGSGHSIYTLVEGQGYISDSNAATRMFVDASGNVYNANAPTARLQRINYQTKVGTESGSPSQPSTDSGWIAVGYALCPFGATNASTQCTFSAASDTIAAAIAAQCGNCVLSGSSPTLNQVGVDQQAPAGSGITGGNGGVGAFNLRSTASSSAAYLYSFAPTAADCGTTGYIRGLDHLSNTQWYIDCTNAFHSASSSYGPTAATVNGTVQGNNLKASSLTNSGGVFACLNASGTLQLCSWLTGTISCTVGSSSGSGAGSYDCTKGGGSGAACPSGVVCGFAVIGTSGTVGANGCIVEALDSIPGLVATGYFNVSNGNVGVRFTNGSGGTTGNYANGGTLTAGYACPYFGI